MLKVAVITCYKDPDYVRARTLRRALAQVPGVEVIEVKNHRTGLMRFPEIVSELVQLRRRDNPDVYLLTFRGYELLPFVLLAAGKKPVIFDEFIQPVEVVTEHRYMKKGSSLVKHLMGLWSLSAPLYYWLLKHCHLILTDTPGHAQYSANLSQVDPDKYLALPVSADESLFRPQKVARSAYTFQVFYYGNMLPLHGVRYVIEAAEHLKGNKEIEFLIVGGDASVAAQVQAANDRGAHIAYKSWIPFEELPAAAAGAHLCLGGPFGDTVQAHNVVTGKTYQFLACAAPTVVGKSRATAEFFADKENSLVVQQASSQALARAIQWAWQHPDELAAIGLSGRKLYEQHFSSKHLAKELRRVMLPLVRAAVTDQALAESHQTAAPKKQRRAPDQPH